MKRGLPPRLYAIGDQSFTMAQLAEKAGVTVACMSIRLREPGMTPEAAVAAGRRIGGGKHARVHDVDGVLMSLTEMAQASGVSIALISMRMRRFGDTPARAMRPARRFLDCECGECRTCRNRLRTRAHYRRKAKGQSKPMANVSVEVFGATLSVAEASDLLGLKANHIRTAIVRGYWTDEYVAAAIRRAHERRLANPQRSEAA